MAKSKCRGCGAAPAKAERLGYRWCDRCAGRIDEERRIAWASELRVERIIFFSAGGFAFAYRAIGFAESEWAKHNQALEERTAKMRVIETAYKHYRAALKALNAGLRSRKGGVVSVTDELRCDAHVFVHVAAWCRMTFDRADRARVDANIETARKILGWPPVTEQRHDKEAIWQMRVLFESIERAKAPPPEVEAPKSFGRLVVDKQLAVDPAEVTVSDKSAPDIALRVLDLAEKLAEPELPAEQRRWFYPTVAMCLHLVATDREEGFKSSGEQEWNQQTS
jgi:hypothetical protein